MEFNYLPLSKTNLQEYKKIFDGNGSNKRTESLAWVHFDNVPNRTMSTLVYNENSIAALYATMPVYFQINGKKELAVQSLDTITASQFRGQGLFVKAASHQYKDCLNEGASLVYGFPNGSSVHGFKKHLNWKMMDPLPFIFKPLRTGYFLKKIFGEKVGQFFDVPLVFKKKVLFSEDVFIEEVKEFDDRVDILWKDFSQSFNISVLRDSEYLNWRYIKKPFGDYRVFQVVKNGKVIALMVYCIKSKHGGKVGYVMELMYLPENHDIGQKLLRVAVNDMIVNKVDTILSWCFDFSPNYKSYRNSGFFSLPDFLRPIELHFGSVVLNGDASTITGRHNWYISYSDSDTV